MRFILSLLLLGAASAQNLVVSPGVWDGGAYLYSEAAFGSHGFSATCHLLLGPFREAGARLEYEPQRWRLRPFAGLMMYGRPLQRDPYVGLHWTRVVDIVALTGRRYYSATVSRDVAVSDSVSVTPFIELGSTRLFNGVTAGVSMAWSPSSRVTVAPYYWKSWGGE